MVVLLAMICGYILPNTHLTKKDYIEAARVACVELILEIVCIVVPLVIYFN